MQGHRCKRHRVDIELCAGKNARLNFPRTFEIHFSKFCRRCFVKTIQMAVSQRLLPLRCVICRAKILRLKQTLIPRDVSTWNNAKRAEQRQMRYINLKTYLNARSLRNASIRCLENPGSCRKVPRLTAWGHRWQGMVDRVPVCDGVPAAYPRPHPSTLWPVVLPLYQVCNYPSPSLISLNLESDTLIREFHYEIYPIVINQFNGSSSPSNDPGVSSVSSATSASTSSSGMSLGKPNRLRQPTGATLRRSQTQSMKLRIQVMKVRFSSSTRVRTSLA